MIQVSIIFNNRQSGKTTAITEEIHELAVQNRTPEVLVVFPNKSQSDYWLRRWRDTYPALVPPRVVTMQNILPVRGYRFEKIYVENIDFDLEGIYSGRVRDLLVSLVDAREPEIVFTCSPLDMVFPDWAALEREEREREEEERLRQEEAAKRFFMVGYMQSKIKQWKAGREEG